LAVLVCWVAIRSGSRAEHAIAGFVAPPPNGISWLVTSIWWAGTLGVIGVLAGLALLPRRWQVIRDVLVSAVGAGAATVMLQTLWGTDGGRPPGSAPPGIDLGVPVTSVAVAMAIVVAMLPYLSRWMQLWSKSVLVVASAAAVVHGAGMPVSVIASLALGWGVTAAVHLVFQSPLGLPSGDEVLLLLGDLDLDATSVVRSDRQDWGVGRFTGVVAGAQVDISIYGRDASDAQLLAKTFRFLLYRDSGPTLALTRRQQVEHEAYLTLTAERAGARVPAVLAAGPAGPARDALLVTRPPPGRLLSTFAPAPSEEVAGPSGEGGPEVDGAEGREISGDGARGREGDRATDLDVVSRPGELRLETDQTAAPTVTDIALDTLFVQVATLRTAGIAHGSISVETVVIGDDGTAGLVDFRAASIRATQDQLDTDIASALAASAMMAGSERTAAAANRALSSADVAGALPFLQRAALDPVAAHSLRGKKTLLANVRAASARVAGVDVPELIEPRRISWVNLLMVAGTLIGGWALIGVLANVTKSWSTITGADWAWVVLVFVLSQSAYAAIAVTAIGSVTSPLAFGRTLALEVSNTFVALAGGSMAVLATRVRFFQKQGYDSTLAVSSGVLVSTASWIVKGALFLVALPIAIGNLHFTSTPKSSGSSSNSHLVWIIVLVVVVIGVTLGTLFAVPRWRRAASQKVRPKISEVWSHLKILAAHPRNLVEIFGGNLVAQVVIALALGAALHAFGDHLGLATLVVVLTVASVLGGVSPVPGGMGVVEAGMILGLTAAGVSQTDAVAATFVQRLFTAYLPPMWGWFVLVWLRRKDYL
jgi:uncharacterized protein (TIRG00374 family)